MKILFVSKMSVAPWAGSEELWARSALRMAKGGHRVWASVERWPAIPPAIAELEKAGARVVFRRGYPRLWGRLKNRVFGAPDFRVLDEGFDLVLISQGLNIMGFDWVRECAARRVPFATLAQSAGETMWPNDALMEGADAAFGAAKKAFFVSRRNLELTRAQLAIPLENAEVVRNPFGVSYDASPAWPAGEIKLACVARLNPESKGQDILFRALSSGEWRRRNVPVSIFGDGPNRKQLERLARMLGLDNVAFRGHVGDVESIWREHHALVLPSRFEGLPLALVEAMLCGRPAVVTDAGGNAEMVEDGATGFVARAATAEDFGDALERAWRERERWPEIGRRAAEAARRRVPADPVGDFVRRLEELAAQGGVR